MLASRPPRAMIRGISAVWSEISKGARGAADRGWLKSTRLPVRVVSVGNIQAGGAGKTPLVARIALEAAERGLKACILCRGYGGEWESQGGVIGPDAAAPSARLCGDEAALLHELAPQAVIGVGADRIAQFERVRNEFGPVDLVILDDGFQHWKIKKDLEIVALTSAGPGDVLYRDHAEALTRANLLVWTKGSERPTGPSGPSWVRTCYRLAPPPEGSPRFWLVTGVADSKDVERLARASGYEVERHIGFPDHASYAEPMVQKLIAEARQAGAWLAVTGKDWVKWREMKGVADLRGRGLAVLEPEIEWLEGRDEWNRLLWER